MIIEFEVLMPPVAKARARTVVNKKSGFVHSFTPTKTVNAEQTIRMAYHAKYGTESRFPRTAALILSCQFILQKPKSAPKKKAIRPITRPDIDNYLKTVMDALNKYAWEDDAQVVELFATKNYGDTPMIKIMIGELT